MLMPPRAHNQSLGGMIGQMFTQPGTYIELKKKGFTDVQIPKWVKRPEPGAGAAPEPGAATLPAPAAAQAEKPATVALNQENDVSQVSSQPSNQVGWVGQVPALQNPEAA